MCAGTHDYTYPTKPLVKPPIVVGDEVWICGEVFIGPGVDVADRAIVAAASVVVKDVLAGDEVDGNSSVMGHSSDPLNATGFWQLLSH